LDGGGRIVQPLSGESSAEESERASANFSLTRGLVLPRFLRRPVRAIGRLNFKLPSHPGLKALAIFCLSTAITGTVMGDHVDTVVSAVTAWSGLAIDEVKITGQSETSELDVLDRLAIGPHPSLVTFDVDGARERVEALPWVKHATIRKLYPDTLQVVVSERTPFAIWQHEGKASLIDRDGRAITDDIGDRYMTLPRVAGADANMHAVEFADLVQAFPELAKRIRAGVLVAGRRWNLVLENGVEVLLPEKDPASAIVAVVAIDAQSQILSRDVAAVDLRLNDRLVVRLTENGEVAREAVLQEREKLAKKKGANT
jgi:cell division protein FtsQ